MLSAFIAVVLHSQTGLVYGSDCAYFLTAPNGWVLDAKSAKSDGVPVCFYPKGGSWKDSTTVMYSRSVPQKGRTLDRWIEEDVAELRKADSSLKTESISELRVGERSAKVLDFKHNKGAARERVAYLAVPKAFVLFTLTTRDEKEFKKSLPAFENLVRSYRYVGEAKVNR